MKTRSRSRSPISISFEKAEQRYCVRISPIISPSGKVQKKRFSFAEFESVARDKNTTASAEAFLAAKAFAQEQREKLADQGATGFTLKPSQNSDAIAALKLLSGRATLVEAAQELLRQRFPRGDKKLLSEAVETYLAELKALERSPHYLKGLDDPLRGLVKVLKKEVYVHEVQTSDVSKFLDSRKCSSNGYNHYREDIARFWRWAQRQAWTNINPVVSIPLKSHVVPPIGILTPQEAHRLLTAAKEHPLLPFVVLGLFTGLRTEELVRLEWDKVLLDDEEPRVLLPARSSKDREFRGIDIPRNAVEWLKLVPFRTGKVVQLSRVADAFTLLHKKCLGRPWPKNAMRHSFVSYTARLRGESHAAEAAGHENVRMTRQHYKALVTTRAATAYFSITPGMTPERLGEMLTPSQALPEQSKTA